MNLAKAIRRGITPAYSGTARGDYIRRDHNGYLISTFGSALVGCGYTPEELMLNPLRAIEYILRMVGDLDRPTVCPFCNAVARRDVIVELHLNDGVCTDKDRVWSKSRIAAWLDATDKLAKNAPKESAA